MSSPINRRGLGTIFKDCPHDWSRCKIHPWRIRYRDASGKQREETIDSATATTPAWNRLEEIRAAKKTGDVSKAAPSVMTFGDYADKWLARRRKLSDSSAKHYEMIIRLHLKPTIGEAKKLSTIGRQTMFDYIESMETAISARYLRDTFWSVLVPMLRSASLDGYMPQLDLRDVELPEIVRRERALPTKEEVEVIRSNVDPVHKFAVDLMAGCGLRIAETLGTDEKCFEAGDFFRTRQQWKETGSLGPLKHRKVGQFRDIPLSPKILEAKEEHTALLKPVNGWIFPSWRKPGWPMSTRAVSRGITKVVEDHGLTKGVTAHSLRHYFATHAVQLPEVDITDVARWLGHKNIQLTYEVYGHLLTSTHGRVRTLLDSLLP